jgi:hypothetical protein
MEEFGNEPINERFQTFREAIKQRVHDVGVNKSSTIRRAQAVERRLFDSFDGDASKVTDDDISKAYDEVDEP